MASTSCPHADVWRLAPARGRPAFRRFIRQGLPAHARTELWALWTGAADAAELAESAHAYQGSRIRGEVKKNASPPRTSPSELRGTLRPPSTLPEHFGGTSGANLVHFGANFAQVACSLKRGADHFSEVEDALF